MRTPQNRWISLADALIAGRDTSASKVYATEETLSWGDLLRGTALDSRGAELHGRAVLVATANQLATVSALIELDGVASRVVLYPHDLSLEYLDYVIDAAGVDGLVSDRLRPGGPIPPVKYFIPCSRKIAPLTTERGDPVETEWVLLTSGTTGSPKLVAHTLKTLAGGIDPTDQLSNAKVWSTFYDIRRYGGLQIFLRAALTGASLILSCGRETTAEFLARAAEHGVTHISGTPSHWRQALMSASAPVITPRYVRLSGEIADQQILNHLRSVYTKADIVHAFASTEGGLAFEVTDGLTGIPPAIIENTPGVDMKIEDGSLRIRSERTAIRYMGDPSLVLKDADGFVDTGDALEMRDDRYHFAGRLDGIINVGGQKVYPEEVEAVINRHPEVQMSRVRKKKSPITGALVIADVVLKTAPQSVADDSADLQRDILQFCREALPSHKVPIAINVVSSLAVAQTGKLLRRYA